MKDARHAVGEAEQGAAVGHEPLAVGGVARLGRRHLHADRPHGVVEGIQRRLLQAGPELDETKKGLCGTNIHSMLECKRRALHVGDGRCSTTASEAAQPGSI